MKRLFSGRHRNTWRYLLHIGPAAAFWLLNFIAATVAAIAMAILYWIDHR
jgi:hypothetical protein